MLRFILTYRNHHPALRATFFQKKAYPVAAFGRIYKNVAKRHLHCSLLTTHC